MGERKNRRDPGLGGTRGDARRARLTTAQRHRRGGEFNRSPRGSTWYTAPLAVCQSPGACTTPCKSNGSFRRPPGKTCLACPAHWTPLTLSITSRAIQSEIHLPLLDTRVIDSSTSLYNPRSSRFLQTCKLHVVFPAPWERVLYGTRSSSSGDRFYWLEMFRLSPAFVAAGVDRERGR